MGRVIPVGFLGVILLATTAQAQAPAPAPASTEAAAPAPGQTSGPVTSTPRRSRLYVGATIGLGGMHDDMDGPFGFGDGNADGASLASDLVIGGFIRPNLVIAGTMSIDWVQEPDVEFNGTDISDRVSVGVLFTAGAVVDYALRPHGSGFHFRGGLGFSRLGVTDEMGTQYDQTPDGLSLLGAAGYEWRVSPEWGIGVLLRVVSAFIDGDNVSHKIQAGSLSLSISHR